MTVIALIDADNFYVSVERIFRADLQGKPVVVLSSNDANVIARSAEAKALKIQMGTPAFQIRTLAKEHGIVQVSSNFSLYGDISARFMKVLALFTPALEEYSIDEAFVDLSHVPREQLREYGQRIRATVMQYVGIPVSIGIAPSKVLAKLMTEVVKHHADYEGVVSYFQLNDQERDDLLSRISVEDIWGVGQKSSTKLHLKNIFTAKQLRDADLVWIRRTLKVVGVRIVLELRGMACMPIEIATKPKQGIMSSQSFSRPIESREELNEAVALYTSLAAMKLKSTVPRSTSFRVHPYQLFRSARAAICTKYLTHARLPDSLYARSDSGCSCVCARNLHEWLYIQKSRSLLDTHHSTTGGAGRPLWHVLL